MKLKLLFAVAVIVITSLSVSAAPTFCITNSYGEQTTLSVTGKSGAVYSLSGSINYAVFGGTIWPCVGTYNAVTHVLRYRGTNPSPDGCVLWAATVDFFYDVTGTSSATGTFSNNCGGSGAVSASGSRGSCGFTVVKLKDGEYGGSGTNKLSRKQLPLPGGVNIDELIRGIDITVSPNPAVSSTQITVSVKSATTLDIAIYDQQGTLIKSLANSSVKAGNHIFTWGLLNNAGVKVKSGYYLVKVVTGESVATQNVLVAE